MQRYFILIILSGFAVFTNAQGVFQRKFEPKQILIFDITLKQQYPGGDMVKRFGKDASLGLDISYKTTSNWVFGLGGHFMFGNTVKEIGILDSLKGENGEIIDENGQFSKIGLDERGVYFGATLGKVISFGGVNKNSGLFISLGGDIYNIKYGYTLPKLFPS